jgi:hypothetical protein
MPLARGTAAVGYTTTLALFWAAGMPVTAHIPRDYQVGAVCKGPPAVLSKPTGRSQSPLRQRPAALPAPSRRQQNPSTLPPSPG